MFRIIWGSAEHSAAGRGILAKMKGPFSPAQPSLWLLQGADGALPGSLNVLGQPYSPWPP